MAAAFGRSWRVLALAGAAMLVTTVACRPGAYGPAPSWPQNWSPDQQARWYAATQGSRLMPASWFRALEQANAAAPFADPANLARYRLLPGNAGLPLGFAIDDGDDTGLTVTNLRWFAGQSSREHWVGMNCAACHTGQIDYGGKSMRIDGGPSLFDYQLFVEELDGALAATRDDPAKWGRFAHAVLGTRDDPANRDLLKAALAKLIAWEGRVEALNQTPLRYGFGRVDAFGHIFNKVALFTGAADPTPNPANAPVSYPFLWDIYRHDRLQWNGIASSGRLPLGGSRYLDYGALGRNSGEVIGVFGEVVTRPGNGLGGYRSSLQTSNLIDMEMQLSTLRAPRWPAAFGALDDTPAKRAQFATGAALFADHCASCHAAQPGTAPYKVKIVPLTPTDPNRTDPWMACNAITYRSATGNLENIPRGYLGNGERFGRDAALADELETVVKGAMVNQKGAIVGHALDVVFGGGGKPRVVIEESADPRAAILDACYRSGSPYMGYKARPLDGIWATAPYLHNGSVANLYELLLAPAQRHTSFRLGTRQYDPALGGYSTRPDAPGNSFTFDTTKPGNGKDGHDYGAGALLPAQRQALLAYLKAL